MKLKPIKLLKRLLIGIIALFFIMCVAFYIYTLDYYKADEVAKQTMEDSKDRMQTKDNQIIFLPDEEKNLHTAFVFYPGGKVEPTAYAPLLKNLSDQGLTCILVKMPFNLAVFNSEAGDKIFGELEDINNWYIGGHSLGGAMASNCIKTSSKDWKGLILLGAYSISNTDLPALAIYGSEDHVLKTSKLVDVNTLKIEGGNHAFYGNYGEQKGDGKATITREEQQNQAVEAILQFIKQ
jgi:hypothetical protein